MISTPAEYNSLYHVITNPNTLKPYIQIPRTEKVYEIDLNTRQVQAPDFLSVEESHNSEIIWFSADRFYDMRDLSECVCWIEYINADKESYYFVSPTTVVMGEDGNEKLLIPWPISKEATKTPGIVEFAFHFYNTVDVTVNGEEQVSKFVYVLNTLPAKSKVLKGLPVVKPEQDSKELFVAETLEALYQRVNVLEGVYALNWAGMMDE